MSSEQLRSVEQDSEHGMHLPLVHSALNGASVESSHSGLVSQSTPHTYAMPVLNNTIPLPAELRNEVYAYLLIPSYHPKRDPLSDSKATPSFVDCQNSNKSVEEHDEEEEWMVDSTCQFWLEPAATSSPGKFTLCRHADLELQAVVQNLQQLSAVSQSVRQESQTFFYSRNSFRVSAMNFEYLPVLNGFLDAIRAPNRSVLENLTLSGQICCMDLKEGSRRFIELLGDCVGLRRLEIQLHLTHFCGWSMTDVVGQVDGQDTPRKLSLLVWARLICRLKELTKVKFSLVLYVDEQKVEERSALDPARIPREDLDLLAVVLEENLVEEVDSLILGRKIQIQVHYVNGCRLPYAGPPWT